MSRQINCLQNMCDMLQAKIDRLARKILKRNTSKSPILVDTNLTLEGSGRQRLTTGQLQAYPWKVQTSYARGRWHQNWVHPSPQRFFCFEVIAAQKEVISQKSIVLRKIRGLTDQCPFFGPFLLISEVGSPDYIPFNDFQSSSVLGDFNALYHFVCHRYTYC